MGMNPFMFSDIHMNRQHSNSQAAMQKTHIENQKKERLPSQMFKAKLNAIFEHIQNPQHPLKRLHYLFCKELSSMHDYLIKTALDNDSFSSNNDNESHSNNKKE